MADMEIVLVSVLYLPLHSLISHSPLSRSSLICIYILKLFAMS